MGEGEIVPNTGPRNDHSYGEARGKYIYIDASDGTGQLGGSGSGSWVVVYHCLSCII